VDKSVFPTLLAPLWKEIHAEHLHGGFRGAGLYPLRKDVVMKKVINSDVDDNGVVNSPIGLSTPHRHLKDAILNALAPPMREATKAAINQSNRKRRRVQSRGGEILTEKEVMSRLQEEERHRQQVSHKKRKRVNLPTKQPPPVINPGPSIKIPQGLLEYVVPSDGNCMFASVAMAVYGSHEPKIVSLVRNIAVDYIVKNFKIFENTLFATHSVSSLAAYNVKMRSNGVYGDHEELLALAKSHGIAITVFTGNSCTPQATINDACREHFHVSLHLSQLHYNLLKETVKVHDWVIVNYMDGFFPGQVENIISITGQFEVSLLKRSGVFWVSDRNSPNANISEPTDIIRKMVKPQIVGSRDRLLCRYCPDLI
jgi:hypothetical protein